MKGTLFLGMLLAFCLLRAGAQVEDALPALVQLLGQTEDTQFQLDLGQAILLCFIVKDTP